ncbi:MAG TPA: two-component regulator propeller domain-containing protein [Verrucomicrobiae bacterium]|nr:two-component regulator propeller domain-containing protein [Verrucomicrobiae bacterium]
MRRAATALAAGIAMVETLLATFSSPAAESPHFVFRSWRAEDGLPQNKVSAIQQTRDGYLWVGTYSGLARFDGVSFTVFHDNNTPAMRNSRVTSLFEAEDGTLWIGHESGDVTRMKDGIFHAVPPPEWLAGKIHTIAADAAGDIWLLNELGFIARVRDRLVLSPLAGSVAKIVQMAALQNGGIAIDREGFLSVLQDGTVRLVEPDVVTTNSYLQGIGPSRNGDLWLLSDLRVRRWSQVTGVEDLGPAPWEGSPVHNLLETRAGLLAAGTSDKGLYLGRPGGDHQQLHRATGFPSDWVTALHEDREGNLWVGTGNNGIVLVRQGMVRTVTPPDQWQGSAVLSVTSGADGALWVGTEGAGLYHYEDDQWSNYGVTAGFDNPYVWSVGEDISGQVWAGTWFGGLLMRSGTVFRTAVPLSDAGGPLLAILPARSGGLWVGGAYGLLRHRNGKSIWYRRAGEVDLRDVNSVVEDLDGTVWFGMASGGIGQLRHGEVRLYRRQHGLSSDSIQCLHLDSDSVLWIGTSGGGLNRLKDGKFTAVGRQHGLANSVICNVQDDGRGYFWLSSHGGIMRVSKAQVNACADGITNSLDVLNLGLSDGLPTLECTGGLQPAGSRTPDGHIWFPTTKGLVTFNPEAVRINTLPPPVVFEEMLTDGETVNLTAATPIQIAPGKHHFEFRYAGLSFVAPEKVRFRCKLEGLETTWNENGTLRSIVYNYIPPGRYTFRVTACNNDGVWNDAGAQAAFEVLPFFWQTGWFRSVIGLAIVGAASGGVWFATRRRMRRKLERLERQRSVERERSRIARDIHDDLGASLTRITMLSQLSPATRNGHSDGDSTAVRNLDLIYTTARELTRAMDEIVWAVNPSHDTLDSLAAYLGKFAQDYLGVAGVRCRLDVPLQLPHLALTAEIRHNLFLAFKEALHNVVKHSGASEVRITLSLSADAFTWEVEDNGRGFNREAPATNGAGRISSGNGLGNIQRRLAETGGACELRSAPGLGTQVQLTVPIPKPANAV